MLERALLPLALTKPTELRFTRSSAHYTRQGRVLADFGCLRIRPCVISRWFHTRGLYNETARAMGACRARSAVMHRDKSQGTRRRYTRHHCVYTKCLTGARPPVKAGDRLTYKYFNKQEEPQGALSMMKSLDLSLPTIHKLRSHGVEK